MGPGPLPLLDRVAGWLAERVRWWVAVAGLVLFAGFIALVLPAQAAAGSFYTSLAPGPRHRTLVRARGPLRRGRGVGRGRTLRVRPRPGDLRRGLAAGVRDLPADRAHLGLGPGDLPGSRWRRIALLPVLVVLLDYAENVCTATVVARHPARTPVLAELAPVFTAAKWLTLTSCFVLLAVGLVAALVAADPPPTARLSPDRHGRRSRARPKDCRWQRAGSRPWTSPPRSRWSPA